MPLSGNQRRHLRALGHHLQPVVQIGHQGVTAGVLGALDDALETHELVKVRFNQTVDDRSEAVVQLAEGTGSECAQVLGRNALLYRRRKKKPTIVLPAPRSLQPGEMDDEEDDPVDFIDG